jgi:chorismate mutase
MKNQLIHLRKQIDEIDRSIVILLAKRMKAVKVVGAYKKKYRILILDSADLKTYLTLKLELEKKPE